MSGFNSLNTPENRNMAASRMLTIHRTIIFAFDMALHTKLILRFWQGSSRCCPSKTRAVVNAQAKNEWLFLRLDLNFGAVGHQRPDLFDLRVGHGDAAQSPIRLPVQRAEIRKSRRQAVNHDVAAGVDSELGGASTVGSVGIGDVQ